MSGLASLNPRKYAIFRVIPGESVCMSVCIESGQCGQCDEEVSGLPARASLPLDNHREVCWQSGRIELEDKTYGTGVKNMQNVNPISPGLAGLSALEERLAQIESAHAELSERLDRLAKGLR